MERSSRAAFAVFFLFAASATLNSAKIVIPEAPSPKSGDDPAKPKVYIIFLERPKGVDPKAFDIRLLARVLGSLEDARKSYMYTYTLSASGFAAVLTLPQVKELLKLRFVFGYMESRKFHTDDDTPPRVILI